MAIDVGKRAKHSAPGQYLGFGLQPIRLCYHLLTAPPDFDVSLEHLDDVAVHSPNGGVLLEQTKSALAHNPLSDWSGDLWKSLANWLNTTHPPQPGQPHTSYHLYVVPPCTGELARAMNDARSPEDVAAVVNQVKAALTTLSKKPRCYSSVSRFLNASIAEQTNLICNFSITSEVADPVDAIRDLIRTTVVPTAMDTICAYAIGNAKDKAEALIRQKKPALLNAGSFQAEFRHFISKINLPALLPFSRSPAPGEIAATLAGRPVFIRQLDFIDVPSDQRIRAVSDYLRASSDKTHWAASGLVFPDSFTEWDRDLLGQHQAVSEEINLTNRKMGSKDRGRLLYARCRQVRRALDGREVGDHFIHGSFHDLADRRELGWHEDYKNLLDKDD